MGGGATVQGYWLAPPSRATGWRHCQGLLAGAALLLLAKRAHPDLKDTEPCQCGYGLVAMTFASHAKGREFDPHYP